MRKIIQLRGHHLLCLLGYRGMGYSPGFCTNMTDIYEQLRLHPDTPVELVNGPDDICQAYPKNKIAHCDGISVANRDAAILERLGVKTGTTSTWSRICALIADKVVPNDVGILCAGCPWEPYGVCREGVDLIKQGNKLPQVGIGEPRLLNDI